MGVGLGMAMVANQFKIVLQISENLHCLTLFCKFLVRSQNVTCTNHTLENH